MVRNPKGTENRDGAWHALPSRGLDSPEGCSDQVEIVADFYLGAPDEDEGPRCLFILLWIAPWFLPPGEFSFTDDMGRLGITEWPWGSLFWLQLLATRVRILLIGVRNDP